MINNCTFFEYKFVESEQFFDFTKTKNILKFQLVDNKNITNDNFLIIGGIKENINLHVNDNYYKPMYWNNHTGGFECHRSFLLISKDEYEKYKKIAFLFGDNYGDEKLEELLTHFIDNCKCNMLDDIINKAIEK